MGERLLCKQEVIGSIPFTSTRLRWRKPSAAARQARGGDMDREKQGLPACCRRDGL